MKQLLLRLAGGAGLATGLVLAASTGASASNGADYNHGQQQSYGQQQNYSQQQNYKQNNQYDNQRGNNYGSNSNVYQASYGRGSGNNNSYGMMYNNQWYLYSQMGYWDNCGHWVAYRSNWSAYDWQQWYQQHCN